MLKFPLILALSLAGVGATAAPSFFITVPLVRVPEVSPASISPELISFGSLQAGDTVAPIEVLVSNPVQGTAIKLGSYRFQGPGGPYRLMTSCDVLKPGDSCSAFVYADATQIGSHNAELIWPHSAKYADLHLSIASAVSKPLAELTGEASFGRIPVGSSVDRVYTLTNKGIGRLGLEQPSAASVAGNGFRFQATTCTSSLAVNSACSVTVRLTGMVAGAHVGSLTLNTTAGNLVSALSGTGEATDVSFTSGAVADFGRVNLGTSVDSAAITLKNSGNIAASGLTTEVVGDGFAIKSNTCGSSLAAGASCAMQISFQPLAAGARSGTLNVKQDNVVQATSPLSGVGTSSALLFNANGQGYMPVTVGVPRSYLYKVQNTGGSPVQLNGVAFATAIPSRFLVAEKPATTTCKEVLAANSSCFYGYEVKALHNDDQTSFAPTAILTSSLGTVQFNAGPTLVTSWANLIPSQPAIDFGSVALGESKDSPRITIRDQARDWARSALNIAVPTGYELVENSCGAESRGSATCYIKLRFVPMELKSYNAELRLTTTPDNGGQPFTLSMPLTATAVAGTGGNWAASEGLVNTEVNSSTTKLFTFANNAAAAVSVGSTSISGAGLSLASTTCTGSLAPGKACAVSVKFAPTEAKQYSGAVSVSLNGVPVSKALSAYGRIVTITTSKTSFPMGIRYASYGQSSSAYSETWAVLTNTSDATAQSLSNVITYAPGDPASYFWTPYNECRHQLPPGASCKAYLRTEGRGVGQFSGIYRYTWASGQLDMPYTFETREPTEVPTVVTPLADVALGSASIAKYRVTIPNRGWGGLYVYTPSISGNTSEFSIASGTTCAGNAVVNNASCDFNIMFTPKAKGLRPAATVAIQVGSVVQRIPLEASGL